MRHLKIYRAIRLIQRTGSIRKAADLLAVSPSALNRSVQGFEEELGLPVFDRVPGGVRLTTAGELMLDLLDRHLVAFDDLRTQLGNLREGVSGTLHLTLGSDIGAGLILATVSAFEDAFPGVSVDVTTSDTALPLQRREADLAILTNPETDDTVEVVHATRIPLAARCSGQTAPLPTELWEVLSKRLLLPPATTGTRVALAHLFRRLRLETGVTSTLAAAQVCGALAHPGRVALFPDTVFEGAEGAAPTERLPITLGDVQLCVLRAARVPMIRPAQAFLTLLQRRLDAAQPPVT
jgi:DNA-binding transcriptional LysR family regulator